MNKPQFRFISGLPRSGSTLLAACLKQNPRFEAGMSSPVGTITMALGKLMAENPQVDSLVDDQFRVRIMQSVFRDFYAPSEASVIFDTNRSWSSRLPELNALFSDVKLIATVRDPAWVLDSLELISARNPLRHSTLRSRDSTIDQRAINHMSPEGMVGRSLSALKEGVYGPYGSQILLVEYDAFCAKPKEVVAAIYNFLGEEYFEHDFSNVSYTQEEFDGALRTPGLHSVAGAVEPRRRRTILPPEVFESYSARAFWQNDLPSNVAKIISV